MAKADKLPEGVKMLVQRHAAVAGTVTGLNAISAMKTLSNVDPTEGVWQKGDEFEIAPQEQIAEAAFVAMINGNKAPAIAVHCTNSNQDKVLYLSTLKKNVVEYEEVDDEFRTVKNADGTTVTHFADTKLRKEIMGKATIGDIVSGLAGRKFRVADIMGPYKTSRLKAVYDNNGNRTYEVVGLRNTSIPVFEEITE